jgi:protein TonB
MRLRPKCRCRSKNRRRSRKKRPPAPVTAKPVKAAAPNVEPSWLTNVVRQLQRFRRYPAAARSRKEEGTVLLSFSVDRAGHVLSRTIARSSGQADLNEEVIAVIGCRRFRRLCRSSK